MENLFLMLNSPEMDEYTRKEIRRFVELKLDEHMKIRGQIAKDLRRIGEDAWCEESAYLKLREKYLRSHQSKKKLAILDLGRKIYCR